MENDFFVKVLISLVIGGLIGAEREYKSKSAGFRTMILICLAANLFTMLSIQIGGAGNPDRIASNILTGLGFLGAGVIFKEDNKVNGITTATTIWITAALGMAVGSGHYFWAIATTVLILLVLFAFTFLQNVIDNLNQIRMYRIVSDYSPEELHRDENLFNECHLNASRQKQSKTGDLFVSSWLVHGTKKNHENFILQTLSNPRIKDFEF